MSHIDRGDTARLDDSEVLQAALVLAIRSLALTHRVDENVRALLADCLLRAVESRFFAAPTGTDAIFALAAHGIERFLGLYNRQGEPEPRTVH